VAKIAGIGFGSTSNSDWDAGGLAAFNALAKELQAKPTWLQLVTYDQAAQVLTRLARAGYPIIVAHSNGYQPAVIEVAKKFPNTWFWIYSASAGKGLPGLPNVVGMQQSGQQIGYLKGTAGCLSTQSGGVGEVFGPQLPSLNDEVSGAKQAAAKYCKGGAKAYHPVFTGSFTSPSKGKQAAIALFGQGVDVLSDTADATGEGSLAAAKANPKARYIGGIANQTPQAPKTVVTNVTLGFTPAFTQLGKLFMAGKLQPKIYPENVQNGGIAYTLPFQNLSDTTAAQKQFLGVVNGIKSGAITVQE
jgi:basic membrane protein A